MSQVQVFDGQTFRVYSNDAGGNCLLYTLQQFLQLRKIRDSGLSVQDLRRKLLVRMDDLVSAPRKNISNWQKIKEQIQRDFRNRGSSYVNDCEWLISEAFLLVVGHYDEIANVYVLDMTEADNVSWSVFFVGKKRNADVNILKNLPVTKAFQVTEKDMVVRFTRNHFELMEPVETTIYPNNALFLKTLLDIVESRSYAKAACERLFYDRRQQDAAELFTKLADRSLELRACLITTFDRLSCVDGSFSKETKKQLELCNVSIDPINIMPLQTMLEERPETIDKTWESGNCRPFTKTTIRQFGNYVVIQLNIFNFQKKLQLTESQYRTLISKVLMLPTNFENRNERQQFQLIGTVNHIGEGRANKKETGGHYVAFIRKQDAWYLCDDTRIKQNDNYANPRHGQPYLLFYKRDTIALDARRPLPLSNLGNSCYLNALMQNIINVPELFGFSGSAPRSATSSGSSSRSGSAPRSATSSGSSSRSGSGPRTASKSAPRLGRASRRAKQNEQLKKIREQTRKKFYEQKFKEKQLPPRKKQKVEPSTDTESDTPEVDDMDDDLNDTAVLQLCSDIEERFEDFVKTLEQLHRTRYSPAQKEKLHEKYYKDRGICKRVYEKYKKTQNRSLMSLSSMTL
jgi:hypothetical protein